MPPLARRNLFHDKIRLAVTLTGITFAVLLVVVELGLFLGFSTTTSSLIDRSGADLWIASKHELGHKNIRTDEPTEKVDTKVLETLIQLDQGAQLPDGLRVDTYIQTAPDVAFK
jgi:hypothetical protein